MAIRYICDRCGEAGSDISGKVGRFTFDVAVSHPLQPKLHKVDGHLCMTCFDKVVELVKATSASKRT